MSVRKKTNKSRSDVVAAQSLRSSMASSSNSEFQAIYDIFLSFRGLDTRKKFADHLYEALKREGFQTFRDDDEIERGENIKSELRKAIWNSMMSVIVLSRNYATSTSCLFEIQKIIEHRKKNPDHFILPVFYEVDPGEIMEQAKKLDFGEEEATVEEVEGWSAVLKEVASMAGMVSKNQSNGLLIPLRTLMTIILRTLITIILRTLMMIIILRTLMKTLMTNIVIILRTLMTSLMTNIIILRTLMTNIIIILRTLMTIILRTLMTSRLISTEFDKSGDVLSSISSDSIHVNK